MPTLRAALGKEYISFGDVASLAINPPGHVANIPQQASHGLSLALEAEARTRRHIEPSDANIIRSLRPEQRIKALTDMIR